MCYAISDDPSHNEMKGITCVPRDYIHIIDLAKGHVHAMKLLFGEDSNKIWAYNLGTGKPHSVLDVLKEHVLQNFCSLWQCLQQIVPQSFDFKFLLNISSYLP